MMKFIDALDLFRSQLIKYLPHFSMMSTKTYIDISSLERQIEWTAPADGYVVTNFRANSTAMGTLEFRINNVLVRNTLNISANSGKHDRIVVAKDDKFQWNCSASYTPAFIGIRFYYCNGTVNI